MKHRLKTLPHFFQAAWVGDKTFEVRKNDRNFKERDEIDLEEWDGKEYSGRVISGVITYWTEFEQKPGYIVFAYRPTLYSE